MKYFCSYMVIKNGTMGFGSCAFTPAVDPYDDILEFIEQLEKTVKRDDGVDGISLLFYSKVKG